MKNFIIFFGISLVSLDAVHCCLCVKPEAGDEVCGSDGKTYFSDCFLFCGGLYKNESEPCVTKVSDGECGSSPCICTDVCAFVCASNGQTYGNECTLKCAKKFDSNLTKVKDGRCGQCVCSADYRPICGSDGETYGNECQLKCQQEINLKLVKVSDGNCTGNSD